MAQIGKLIVITGQTGSGKDTVVEKLLILHPSWQKIVTGTTRQPRENEINHIDYDFIDVKDFQKLQSQNRFLETNEYAGNFYGTPKSALDQLILGKSLIWRIDISMAAKVLELLDKSYDTQTAERIKSNTRIIFLKLQDDLTQKQRLQKRGMDEHDIGKRVEQENRDLALGNFENIVINYDGQLEKTMQTVEQIISA